MPDPRLTIIDPEVEATILAYHVGRDTRIEQQPEIGAREVQAEVELDIWTAVQQGAF